MKTDLDDNPRYEWSKGLSTMLRRSLQRAGYSDRDTIIRELEEGVFGKKVVGKLIVKKNDGIGKIGICELKKWLGFEVTNHTEERYIRFLEKRGYVVTRHESKSM